MNYMMSDPFFKPLIENIDYYFLQEDNTVICDRRNVIKIINFKNKKYVVKSFKVPHLLNRVIYGLFRSSKAKRSYINSKKLLAKGINTPVPIGYIEFTSSIFFDKSYYISEYIDFDFEIRAVLSDKNFPNREELLNSFMEFTSLLHQKGIYHIDYSPGNILVRKDNNKYSFSIVDVNRMKFQTMDIKTRMKSISKLTDDIEDSQKLIFYYSKHSGINKEKLEKYYKKYLDKQKNYLARKAFFKKIRKLLINR